MRAQLIDIPEDIRQAQDAINEYCDTNPGPWKVDDIYDFAQTKGWRLVATKRALLTMTRDGDLRFIDLLETVARTAASSSATS